jgi:HD-like signal output (HDOD) protein
MANDETSSLSLLGQSVLHDHGLTSRILKVVNSVHYNRSRQPITTVSRAAVVLGYDQLKHICITARMIDSMLASRDMDQAVFERLLKLMAHSFHAAMLAKMMLSLYSRETQEEVYIAALLHHMGEVAFWSMGGRYTRQLNDKLEASTEKESDVIQTFLGTSFEKLSIGLARSWNMGPMLIKSLDHPDQRSPEFRCINLAFRLSRALHGLDIKERHNALKATSELTGFGMQDLTERVAVCHQQTQKLASSYGASALRPYLQSPENKLESIEETKEAPLSKEQLQLNLLREMTQIAIEKPDINLLFHTLMEGIQRGIAMTRVVVLMVNQDQKWFQARFVTSRYMERDKKAFRVQLHRVNNIFSQIYNHHDPIWVDDQNKVEFASQLTLEIQKMTQGAAFFAAPIVIDERCIAIIYADSVEEERELKREAFDCFVHFVRQANLCISVLLKRPL